MPVSVAISAVGGAISGYVLGAGTFAAFTQGALLAGLKTGLITGALKGLATVLFQKDNVRAETQKRTQQLYGTDAPERWVIGHNRISGQVAFAGSDPNNSRIWHMVVILSSDAINGLERIFIEGEEIFLANNVNPDTDPFGDGDTITAAQGTKFEGHFEAYLSFNALGRNETDLGTIFGDWHPDDTLEGYSYLHLKFTQNGDRANPLYRNKFPHIEAIVQGIKIALPNDTETGEGTPVFTRNAADARYWYHRVRRGYPPEAIPRNYYRQARMVSAQMRSFGVRDGIIEYAQRQEPLYTFDGVIYSGDNPEEVENLMDFAWQGSVVEVDGLLRYLPGVAKTPEFNITDDMIKETGSFTISPPIQDRYNGYTARLAQSNRVDYQEQEIPEYIDQAARDADGQARTADFGTLPYTIDSVKGLWFIVVNGRRVRKARVWPLTLTPGEDLSSLNILPGTWGHFSISKFGIDNQLAECLSSTIHPDMSVTVVLQETDPAFFDPRIELGTNQGLIWLPNKQVYNQFNHTSNYPWDNTVQSTLYRIDTNSGNLAKVLNKDGNEIVSTAGTLVSDMYFDSRTNAYTLLVARGNDISLASFNRETGVISTFGTPYTTVYKAGGAKLTRAGGNWYINGTAIRSASGAVVTSPRLTYSSHYLPRTISQVQNNWVSASWGNSNVYVCRDGKIYWWDTTAPFEFTGQYAKYTQNFSYTRDTTRGLSRFFILGFVGEGLVLALDPDAPGVPSTSDTGNPMGVTKMILARMSWDPSSGFAPAPGDAGDVRWARVNITFVREVSTSWGETVSGSSGDGNTPLVACESINDPESFTSLLPDTILEGHQFIALGGDNGLWVLNTLTGVAEQITGNDMNSDRDFHSIFALEEGGVYRFDDNLKRTVREDQGTTREVTYAGLQKLNLSDRDNLFYDDEVWDLDLPTGVVVKDGTGTVENDNLIIVVEANAEMLFVANTETGLTILSETDGSTYRKVSGTTYNMSSVVSGAIRGVEFFTDDDGDTDLFVLTKNSHQNKQYLYKIDRTNYTSGSLISEISFDGTTNPQPQGLTIYQKGLATFVADGTNPKAIYTIDTRTGDTTKLDLKDHFGLTKEATDDIESLTFIPQQQVVEFVPPGAPTNFNVQTLPNGERSYSWTPPSDIDYSGVEIRYSTTETDPWGAMTKLSDGLITANPYQTQEPSTAGVAVTFECRAIDGVGSVSRSGARITTTLGAPPNASAGVFRGNWLAGTVYSVLDIVRYQPEVEGSDNGLYICEMAHTADDTNKPPNTTFWELYLQDGVVGEDGQGIERIYTRTADPTLRASKRPLNTWKYDQPGTVDGQVWTDNVIGVTSDLRYLWEARRAVPGSPATGTDVVADWEEPAIISSWGSGLRGEDGADGTDGNGVEYIFAINNSDDPIPSTQLPDNSWGFDSPGTVGGLTWHDGAPSVTTTNRYLWQSWRTVPGNPAVGTAVTDQWSTPRILATWGSGIPGVDGEDGQGFEYIFTLTSFKTAIPQEKRPNNSWLYDAGGTADGQVWTDGAQDVTATNRFLWRSSRTVKGDLSNPGTNDANLVKGNWLEPTIISSWGSGIDGQTYEYVFTVTSTMTLASNRYPSNSWLFDAGGTVNGQVWTDDAQGVTQTNRFLWRAQRTIRGDVENPGTNDANLTKGHWQTPKIVGTWGTGIDGIDGANGADGIGYQYAYTLTSTTSLSSSRRPSNSWNFGALRTGPQRIGGQTWYVGALGVTETNRYLWQSFREVRGRPANNAQVPARWSTPVIISSYGSGVAGADGDDGAGVEYVFRTTTTTTRPSSPSNSWGYDSPGSPWQDGAPALSSTNKYLWRSERQVLGVPSRGASVSDSWSTPVIVGTWGDNGEDGSDGNGIEFIFAVASTTQVTRSGTTYRLNSRYRPSNTWGFDSPGTAGGLRWYDGSPETSASRPYLFSSQRRIPGAPTRGSKPSGTGSWTTPSLIGTFAEPQDPTVSTRSKYIIIGDKQIVVGVATIAADTNWTDYVVTGTKRSNFIRYGRAFSATPALDLQLANPSYTITGANRSGFYISVNKADYQETQQRRAGDVTEYRFRGYTINYLAMGSS